MAMAPSFHVRSATRRDLLIMAAGHDDLAAIPRATTRGAT